MGSRLLAASLLSVLAAPACVTQKLWSDEQGCLLGVPEQTFWLPVTMIGESVTDVAAADGAAADPGPVRLRVALPPGALAQLLDGGAADVRRDAVCLQLEPAGDSERFAAIVAQSRDQAGACSLHVYFVDGEHPRWLLRAVGDGDLVPQMGPTPVFAAGIEQRSAACNMRVLDAVAAARGGSEVVQVKVSRVAMSRSQGVERTAAKVLLSPLTVVIDAFLVVGFCLGYWLTLGSG